MKPETIAPTSLSPTAAPSVHLSPSLDWQSELARRQERVMIIPISRWVHRSGKVVEEPPSDKSAPIAAPPADWSCVEARLQEIYPTPIGGVSLAELVSEGRGDR